MDALASGVSNAQLSLIAKRQWCAAGSRHWPDRHGFTHFELEVEVYVADIARRLARQGRWIRTVFGYGYAFAGEAESGTDAADRSTPAEGPRPVPTRWLLWRRQILPLAEGENVVGRGREAQVRIPASEVSRRHARIVVEAGGVTIEDLESRNGTFVRGRPVKRSTPLADGDEVGFGPELTTFCAPSPSTSTRAVKKRRR